jgi:hypothetical protein
MGLGPGCWDEGWKSWLDVLVGYLLRNDPDQEYLLRMPAGHLERPEGTTRETHPGVIIHGENHRIDHLSKASELCCGWIRSKDWKQQSSPSELPMVGNSSTSRTSAKDRSTTVRAETEAANQLLAAMHRQGLNAPRLALLVRSVLRKRGVTKPKVDGATIYNLVHGQTRRPDPSIRNAVLEVLKLSVE